MAAELQLKNCKNRYDTRQNHHVSSPPGSRRRLTGRGLQTITSNTRQSRSPPLSQPHPSKLPVRNVNKGGKCQEKPVLTSQGNSKVTPLLNHKSLTTQATAGVAQSSSSANSAGPPETIPVGTPIVDSEMHTAVESSAAPDHSGMKDGEETLQNNDNPTQVEDNTHSTAPLSSDKSPLSPILDTGDILLKATLHSGPTRRSGWSDC